MIFVVVLISLLSLLMALLLVSFAIKIIKESDREFILVVCGIMLILCAILFFIMFLLLLITSI